jgi:uncharacterized membrane protein YkgB
MSQILALTRSISYPLLRITMGIVVGWIGVLKFVDPSPVVGLLGASFPFLASPIIVYILGAIEVALALALFANLRVEYVGLILMGLFVGTLTILVIAPQVSGIPLLTLAGEFLLKDLVLFAASCTLTAMASSRAAVGDMRAELRQVA